MFHLKPGAFLDAGASSPITLRPLRISLKPCSEGPLLREISVTLETGRGGQTTNIC